MTTPYTIYHNPRCSKSRQTLAILEDKGLNVEVIKYLETPLQTSQLKTLLATLNISARDLLRKGEDAYKELGLANTDLSDDDLIQAMSEHPKLIERPIVVYGKKAIIGRPPEKVLELI